MNRVEKGLHLAYSVANWLLYLPLSIGFTLLTVLLSWLLPIFSFAVIRQKFPFLKCFSQIDGYLPGWLSWFQTPDNSLDGDNGWKTEHWPYATKYPNSFFWKYLGRMLWLIRNPGYGFEWIGPIGAKVSPEMEILATGNPNVRNRPNGQSGLYLVALFGEHTYWQLTWVVQYGSSNYCFYLTLGWKVRTYAEDPSRLKTESQAMYCFSPRIVATFSA